MARDVIFGGSQQPLSRKLRAAWLEYRLACARRGCACNLLALLAITIGSALLVILLILSWAEPMGQRYEGQKGAGENEVPEDVARLAEWLIKHGGALHECLKAVRCGSGGGRCVRAAGCTIQAGDRVVAVPRDVQLSAAADSGSKVCPDLEKWLHASQAEGGFAEWHLDPQSIRLKLRLLEETALAQKSAWSEYLPTIPIDFPLVMRDEATQQRCFNGTLAALHVARRFERRAAELLVLQRCRAVSGVSAGETAIEEEVLHWAMHVVASRAYETPDGEILAPFADLFNDDTPRQNAEWRHETSSGRFEIVAAVDIPSGTEVTISYGPKTSEQLLTHYGFQHVVNRNDVLNVPMTGAESALSVPMRGSQLSLSLDDDIVKKSFLQVLNDLRSRERMQRGTHDKKAGHDDEKVQRVVGTEANILRVLQSRCAAESERLRPQNSGLAGPSGDDCRGYRLRLSALAYTCACVAADAIVALQALPGEAGRDAVEHALSFQPASAMAADAVADAQLVLWHLRKEMLQIWIANVMDRLPMSLHAPLREQLRV